MGAVCASVTKIELLPGQSENPVGFSRNDNNSNFCAKIINGIEKSYSNGENFLMKVKKTGKTDNTKLIVSRNGKPVAILNASRLRDKGEDKARRVSPLQAKRQRPYL